MSPDEFEAVQELFLDAIKLPEDGRQDYVRTHAGGETIAEEVLSLLQYHDNQTLLPETAISVSSLPESIDETLEFEIGQVPDASPAKPSRSVIGLLDIESSIGANERFAQSTNLLLRNRLIAATFVLAGMSIVVTLVALIFGDIVLVRLAVRAVTVALLGVFSWILIKWYQLPRHWLRTIEVLIVAVPLIELSLIQWFESTKLLIDGETDQIEELRAIVFTVVSIYIAIYGIFIPSNWRRTAIVTGSIAILPTVVSVAHQSTYSYPPEIQWMHFANPTLVAVMAVVATVGSGIVHRVRREAESAKYYGQYQLIEEIGRGGMGIVYLGKHHILKRPAAIKLIHGEAAGSPHAIAQFEKEVQATATLSHWNTVQIYDYGITDAGDFYCVMEYLRGVTLQQRLYRRQTLDVKSMMEIVIQICDGLEEAHLKGMVHRDIKPANIFLAEVGGRVDVVKILDFGLVITNEESAGEQGHMVGGTPAYMSPEQIRGEPLDGRSDLYAIGCVMVEALTGTPPFQSFPITQLLADHLFRIPKLDALAEIDAGLPPVIERCLAKDRDNRFAGVAELRDACRGWV